MSQRIPLSDFAPNHILMAVLAVLFFAGQVEAQAQVRARSRTEAETKEPSVRSEVDTLKARIEELEHSLTDEDGTLSPETEELMRLRLELQLPSRLNANFTGLGPGASKVYFSNTPLSVGGYGEIQFAGNDGTGASGNGPKEAKTARLKSFSPFLGFRFSRELVFNSSYSFVDQQIEFAYIDFLFKKETGIRAGHILVPFGLTNLRFEPNLYHTVNRPMNEMLIVPTLWHETGLIGFARFGDLLLQGGVINALDAGAMKTDSWVRRTTTSQDRKIHNLAAVVRAELNGRDELFKNSSFGFSMYYGPSAQGDNRLGDASVFLGSVHGEWRWRRLASQFSYTEGHISDTDKLAANVSGANIGKSARGANITIAYDLLERPAGSDDKSANDPFVLPVWRELPVFVSWETANLNSEAPVGQSADSALDSTIWTIGANYKPHPQVVIKADYAMAKNAAGRTQNTAEASIGFAF